MARNDCLKIDIQEPILYKIIGMNRVKLSFPEPVILIQASFFLVFLKQSSNLGSESERG